MKYLDLFAGVGGFALGIEQAYEKQENRCRVCEDYSEIDKGFRCKECADAYEFAESWRQGQSELEPATLVADTSSKCTEQSTPTCIGFSEIDKYATKVYQHHFPTHKNYGDITKIDEKELPDFDLLVGGFPCPSWSIAGKRGGFEDLRGQLVFDIIRILRGKKPRMFVLENVKGILSHDKGNSMEVICEALCESGYAIDFEVLNSKDFGVPQNRERVFIIGKRLDTLPKGAIY